MTQTARASAVPVPFDLNPVSPHNLFDPAPLYRELLRTAPVYWSDAVHGWFVTRYEDVAACHRDPRLSANRAMLFEAQVQGEDKAALKDFLGLIRKMMFTMDGTEHMRVRRPSMPPFTPQALESWYPVVRRTLEELVDRVLPRGRMDLAKEISYAFPALVIAELFGIPTRDRERFQEWSAPIVEISAPGRTGGSQDLARRANTALVEFHAYLMGLVAERRQSPGGDVISQMLAAENEGRLTSEDVVANAIQILFAGHTTTTDLLSNGIHELLMHPDQLQLLRDNPRLLKGAVEEVLRYSTSVPFNVRIAIEDIPLRGQLIPKGSLVFLGLAAANRDPDVFPEPDRFDITRDFTQQKHLSFGFGQHHCLGTVLARREMEIAFEVLLQRMPGLCIDEQQAPVRCHNLSFRGFTSLHIRW